MHLLSYPAEEEVPIEPPSATTTTTIGISATSTTFNNTFGKKRANVATTPSTNRKKNKTKDSPSEPIILQDPLVALAQQKADKNKIHGEPRGGGAPGGTSDSNLDSTDCNSESSNGSKSQELPDLPSSSSSSAPSVLAGSNQQYIASEKRLGHFLLGYREEKVMVSISKPQQK